MKADFFISLCHFFGMTVSPLTIVQCPRVAEHLVLLAAAKSLQSCPTLCDPVDGSPPGSPVPGTLQARTVEWVAISFSNAGKWKVKGKLLSRVRLFATPWTAAYQAPPPMGFSRQEYWSGVPLPSPLVLLSWMKIRLDLSLQNLNFKALRFEEVTYHIIILFHFFTFSYHCFPHNSTHLYFKGTFIYLLIFDCAGSLLRLPWWLRW